MSALQIVINLLTADATVTAITTPQRIYPIIVPQGSELPAIVARITGGYDGKHLDGADQYYRHRVTVECLSPDPDQAVALGDAVMAALGDVVRAVFMGMKDIVVLFADMDFTDYSDDRSVFRRTLDFRVRWRRLDD